jgi:hypothetical protein
MSDGIVYVLSNPAMPRMVKIGRTGREIGARLSDLYTTGVPLPFECEYAARVKDQNEEARQLCINQIIELQFLFLFVQSLPSLALQGYLIRKQFHHSLFLNYRFNFLTID